jgi:putative transposase
MRKVKFAEGEYYHIYNRGVEKRNIFMEKEDYERFILGLKLYNSQKAFPNIRRIASHEYKLEWEGDSIVEIICYCLMPNHFHLILKQNTEDGISRFMHKLGTGYTNYFNLKYERSGRLFQGPFKAIHIDRNEYLLHLSRYIHLNPLDIIKPDWKEKGIRNKSRVTSFLKEYPWSSLKYFIHRKISKGAGINPEIVKTQFATPERYLEFLLDWIPSDYSVISNLIIEL